MSNEPHETIRHSDEDDDVAGTVTYHSIEPKFSSQRYKEQRFHARGGMGEVWLARDDEIGRFVALKTLRKTSPDSEMRFLAEAQITGQLEHPGIVPVHDVGVDDDGRICYVMKFVQGSTLAAAIDDYHEDQESSPAERQVAWLRLLEHFVNLCETVAYAHSRGVVHRDIKPDNIMIGPFGETLVVDWGLAKVLNQPELPGLASSKVSITSSGSSTATHYGSVLGTPSYMPPELADGRAAEVGPACDVYLLGATLYYLLTGQAPRRGQSREEMVEMARTTTPLPPRKLNPKVPAPLAAIAMKAMAKQEKHRYQEAQDLAREVRRFLAGERVLAHRENLPTKVWRWTKRHRLALTRGATAATLVGLMLFSYLMLERARKATAIEQARQQVAAFRQHADDFFFAASSRDAPQEEFPYFDLQEGTSYADAALVIAESWGVELQEFLLDDERDAVREQLYDLLLLHAQVQLEYDDQSEEALDSLNRASALRAPSQGHYNLLAQAYEQIGDEILQDGARGQMEEEPPSRALDYFLTGERFRLQPVVAVDPDDLLNTAVRRDLQPAIEAYQAALRLDEGHFWSHYQLARCYLASGRVSEAIGTLAACIALRPESPWPYSTRGLAFAMSRRYDDAQVDLDKALELDDQFQPARLHRGWLAWRQDRVAQAMSDFETVLASESARRLNQAAYYMGQIHRSRGEYRQARQHLTEFRRANPAFRPVYRELAAVTYLDGADDEAATSSLNRFLELGGGDAFDIDSDQAAFERGRFLRQLALATSTPTEHRERLFAAALAEYGSIPVGNQWPKLCYEMGLALEKTRQFRQAYEIYNRGLELDPANLPLLNKRGYLALALGQQDEAAKAYAQATALLPAAKEERVLIPEAHTWLGNLRALKKDSEAERDAIRALLSLEAVDPNDANRFAVLHNLACIFAELAKEDTPEREQRHEMAIMFLEQALTSAETHGRRQEELQNISVEPAFGPELRKLPAFQKLVDQTR